MERPLPTGLIGGATDGHAADADELKLSLFFEGPDFVGVLQNASGTVSSIWLILPRAETQRNGRDPW